MTGSPSLEGNHQIVELAIIREPAIDSPAAPEHDSVGLRARQELAPRAPLEEHEIRGQPRPDPARAGQAHEVCWRAGRRSRPIAERAIEVTDARGLAEHLEHVVVPVAVKGVAAVVAGDGDAHAAGGQLVQQRYAAPARRPSWHAILKIEVAHRKADHADAGLDNEIERLVDDL